jgi:glutaminase
MTCIKRAAARRCHLSAHRCAISAQFARPEGADPPFEIAEPARIIVIFAAVSQGDGMGAAGAGGLIADVLGRLHAEILPVAEGRVADYIPELGKADPTWFGFAMATTEGQVYGVGDADLPFTIQSVSKPFLYGYALHAHGQAAVLRAVGVEPTGEAFNSIVLDEKNNRPFNPMVNAGAIAVSGLVTGADAAARRAAMLEMFGAFAGRPLAIDEAVYRSELATGHRNRAIAYLMLNSGMISGDADAILDLYFRQCSVLVTARDLAVMAATLANDGVNPVTGARVLGSEHVRDVLSVMTTCGMYDYAGQWAFEVGMPAKSGVSGAIIAVVPGQVGLCAFSPRWATACAGSGSSNGCRASSGCIPTAAGRTRWR